MAATTGKQIVEMTSATKIETGDLIAVRKSAEGADKKIAFQDLQSSLGHSAVVGYTATQDVDVDENVIENYLTLTASNNASLSKYYNMMKLSFMSPIQSNGEVYVRIGSLTHKKLKAYKSTSTAVLDVDDYIEAVYVEASDEFKQVNTTSNIYTNDYVLETYEYAQGDVATTLYLNSAYGSRKHGYYPGMMINFFNTVDTKGFVRVNIDGLGLIDLIEGDVDDLINTPLYTSTVVQAVFNGEAFILNQYNLADKVQRYSVKPEDYTIVENEDGEEEILANLPVSYKHEFTVGSGGKFANLPDAINACIKEFGKDGGGHEVTLKVISTLSKNSNLITMRDANISWITLSSVNNLIKFTGSSGDSTFMNFTNSTLFKIADFTIFECDYDVNIMCNNCNMLFKNITFKNFSFYLSNSSKCEAVKCEFIAGGAHNIEAGIFTLQASTLKLTYCKAERQTTIYTRGTNSTIYIENCDLSYQGQVTVASVFCYLRGNYGQRDYENITINQYYSKAKVGTKLTSGSNLNTEIIKNTNEKYTMNNDASGYIRIVYNVEGDQNSVGA